MSSVEINTERAVGVAGLLDGQVAAAGRGITQLSTIGSNLDVATFTGPMETLLAEFVEDVTGAAAILRLRVEFASAADNRWSPAYYDHKVAEMDALLAQTHAGLDDGVGSSGAPSTWEHLTDWAATAFQGDGVPFGEGPGEFGGPAFVIGPPTQPHIEWDEDYIYDSESAGWRDHLSKAEWQAKLAGGRLLRGDLDDATQFYRHYWDNNGEHRTFDYEEAYVEDPNVRLAIDNEIIRAQHGAETFIVDGHTEFSITGDARVTTEAEYPATENWQKTIGGHQVWSSADVTVDGNTVTMVVTVHGEDYYNFNRGQSDIASQAPDDENGRFTEIGWAQPFPSSGAVERTVTWTVGDAPSATTIDGGSPERNPGREDNEIERDAGSPDRTSLPDNNRETGGTRVDG